MGLCFRFGVDGCGLAITVTYFICLWCWRLVWMLVVAFTIRFGCCVLVGCLSLVDVSLDLFGYCDCWFGG